MNIEFPGRVVAVSGGGWGIGRGIVERFAGLGACVFCCDVSAARLDQVAAPGVDRQVVDLADRRAAAGWIARIEASAGKPVDVLVNNAGGFAGAPPRPLEEVSDDEWDRVMAANVDAAFVLSRAVAPGMKRSGGGRIVNISSGAGLAASRTRHHAYTAAKHAVVGLTRQTAAELGAFGITVNSVAPGFVISNADTLAHWRSLGSDAQEAHVEATFMRRVGTVDDVCNTVLFLASEHASWITGQVMLVNGGQ